MSDQLTVAVPADVDEMKAYIPVHRRTYLMTPDEGDTWAEAVELPNVRIAKRGDRPVGGMTLRPMGQWFGGRAVPMTGISAVGIEPAERARGTGTAFMRAIVEELHASGVALSALFPATQTIYRRCGYEIAGDFVHYRLRTDDIDVRDRTLEVELTSDRDAIVSMYEDFARHSSGLLDRSEAMWKRVFEPWKRETDSYLFLGSHEPEGYIVYSREPGERMRGGMSAHFVALTPAAARRMLTFVADHRSFVGSLDWVGPPSEPLRMFLSEPRIEVHRSFPWMLRIVDVRAALRERGYADRLQSELHLRVRDDVLAANDGAFVLRVAGGKGEIESGGEGRLEIDVRGLSALYAGYMSAHSLVAAGYVQGAEEDLLTADAIFAGPAPWLADFF
jgi:predicted acetyltransferase